MLTLIPKRDITFKLSPVVRSDLFPYIVHRHESLEVVFITPKGVPRNLKIELGMIKVFSLHIFTLLLFKQ